MANANTRRMSGKHRRGFTIDSQTGQSVRNPKRGTPVYSWRLRKRAPMGITADRPQLPSLHAESIDIRLREEAKVAREAKKRSESTGRGILHEPTVETVLAVPGAVSEPALTR